MITPQKTTQRFVCVVNLTSFPPQREHTHTQADDGLFWWPRKIRKQGAAAAAIKAGCHKAAAPPPPASLAAPFMSPFLPLSGPIPPLPSAQVQKRRKNKIQRERLISSKIVTVPEISGEMCPSTSLPLLLPLCPWRVLQKPGDPAAESGVSPAGWTAESPRSARLVERIQLQKKVRIRSSGGTQISRISPKKFVWRRTVYFPLALFFMSAVVKYGTSSLQGLTSSSAAHRTTHRLSTDTRTRLPREGRGLTNRLLRRSSAALANRGASAPRGTARRGALF